MEIKSRKGKINLIRVNKRILSTILLMTILGINTIIFPEATYSTNEEDTYSGISIYTENEVTSLNEGDIVNIIIKADENMEKLASFDGFLNYDTTIFEKLSENNEREEWEGIAQRWENDFCYEENSEYGQFYFGCANTGANKYDTNGELIKVKLTVKKATDTTTVKVENVNVLTADGKNLEGNNAECTIRTMSETKNTITFNSNTEDEVTNIPKQAEILNGEEYEIPRIIPQRKGYWFVKWTTNPDGTGESYIPTNIINVESNIELYAQWKKICEIAYNSNTEDEVNGIPEKELKLENDEYTISNIVPTREGYKFIGWNTQEDGTGTKYGIGQVITITEKMTLYAQWQKEPEVEKLYLSTDIYKIGENDIKNYENGDIYITKIKAETKLTDFINQLDTNGNVEVYNKKELKLTDKDIIGTGMKLIVTKDEEKIELIIAVIGDLDGNGKITITDLSEMNKALLGIKKLEGEYKLAADFDDNNKVTVTDLSMLNKELLK